MVKRIKLKLSTKVPVEITDPELVFGIVGPIGVDVGNVLDALSAALKEVHYTPIPIHLTQYINHKRIKTEVDNSSYSKRYLTLIEKANEYRRLAKNSAALAGLAILNIQRLRKEETDDPQLPKYLVDTTIPNC